MSTWKSLALAFVALISLSPTAFARTHFGTVALTDGQRIEAARYKVKPLFRLVEITQIGSEQVQRQFKFEQIEALYDKNGKDVTRKYLGRYARVRMARRKDSIQTARAEYERAIEDSDWASPHQRRHAAPLRPRIKLWNIAAGVGANYSVPDDRFISGDAITFGLDAKLIAPINSFLALRGTVSRSVLRQSPVIILSESSSHFAQSNNDNSRTLTRMHLALQYYFYNRRETYPPSFVGFIYTGAGAVVKRDTYRYFSHIDSSGIPVYASYTNSTTNLISSTGIGFDAFLTPRFGLEFGVNLDVAFLEKQGAFDPKFGYIFDFRLSAMTFF